MGLMTVYAGKLSGGPDEGNYLEASVSEIPAKESLSLWLDGPEGEVTIFETTGKYVFDRDDSGSYFKWEVDDTKIYRKKEL